MNRQEFGELTVFLAICDAGSFRSAARRLGVAPSALSRTLAKLESRLGLRLLNRTTRSVSLTEAGALLSERLRPVLTGLETAMEDISVLRNSPAGTVRLNLPRLAAELILAPRLLEFHARHPGIRLDLTIDDALTDVIAGGFDAGIRIGERLAQDMIGVRLTSPFRVAVVGSPGYFARRPAPRSPRDLYDHTCVTYRWAETGQLHRWRFDTPDGAIQVEVHGPLVVNDTGLILQTALMGLGLAYLPEVSVAAPLADGSLIRVLEPWCKPISGFYLYHPSRQRTPPALRALIAFLQEDVRNHPP